MRKMTQGAGFIDDICPRRLYRFIVLWTSCLCISAAQGSGKGKTSCSIPPVQRFQDTVLTCTFPEDLSVTQKGFSVYHYVKGVESDAVIDCSWISGKLECTILPGYKYNSVVGTQMTATISRVDATQTGLYACQVSGYPASSFETCQLQLKHDENETCSVTKAGSESKFFLICYFSKDVSVGRWNFTVYKHIGQDKQGVVDCWWENEGPNCHVETGYQYNYGVSSNLTVGLPLVATEDEEIYSCWHAGSGTSSSETCSFKTEADASTTQGVRDLAIGLSLGFMLAVALISGIIFLLCRKRVFETLCAASESARTEAGFEETHPMLQANGMEQNGTLSGDSEDSQVKKVREMYPDILNSSYFLPPVYFNKARYRKECEAGQTVYVPEKTDHNDVIHDRAMQHVLHCLRQMADKGQDIMFVFVGEYTQVKCLDFLVVHRQHGVLAVVVKAVSEKDFEGKPNEQTSEVITAQVTEAVEQLKKADKQISEVMSDLKQKLHKYRKSLILPHLTSKALGDAIGYNHSLAKALRECLGVPAAGNLVEACVCTEDLSDPSTPWNVTDDVINKIRQKWNWTPESASSDVSMAPGLYLGITAKIFEDASHSTLQFPDDDQCFPLPKTLSEAVSLTGDLYERSMLDPKLKNNLDKPIVFLVGPPNTGKTRMLTLVGGKWLNEKHKVVIVKDSSSKIDPFLSQHLKTLATERPEGFNDDVIDEKCNPKSKASIEKFVQRFTKKTGTKPLYILLDVAHIEGKHLTGLYKTLKQKVSDLHLWVSCTGDECPTGVSSECLQEILNCPPAVVREFEGDSTSREVNNLTDLYHPYTDGPPVKHIYHKEPVNPLKPEPMHDCQECGIEVGRFLAEVLLVGKTGENGIEALTNTSANQAQIMKESVQKANISPLNMRDILVVFEFNKHRLMDPDVKDDSEFLTGLRHSGITVRAAEIKGDEVLSDDDSDSACAMHMRHMQTYRRKKKIVVYVESPSRYKDVENKRRALTSCTSQLILVHPKPQK